MKQDQTFHYSSLESKKINYDEMRKRKINRIISISNFDNEVFSEEEICVCKNPIHLMSLLKLIDESWNTSTNSHYYVATTEDYELYTWEP